MSKPEVQPILDGDGIINFVNAAAHVLARAAHNLAPGHSHAAIRAWVEALSLEACLLANQHNHNAVRTRAHACQEETRL